MNQFTDTSQLLLTVGRHMFAEQGFDATSLRDLTTSAGANLGAVTYHFGSKQQLYDAVLDQLFGQFADCVEAAAAESGPAAERIPRIVHAIFAFFAEHPEAPQLILRELARAGSAPSAVIPYARRNLAAIGAAVHEAQQAGELRDVDPVLVTFTILSQSIWFTLVRDRLAEVSGRPLGGDEGAGLMERHIADVVLRAFVPAGAEE